MFLVLSLASFAFVGTSAAPAFARTPWWHLTSGARPTYLIPGTGTGVDAVQELKVEEGVTFGKKGAIFMLQVGKGPTLGKFATEEFALLGQAPTVENIRKALEKAYGVGEVVVEETSALTFSVKTLTVAKVAPLEAEAEFGAGVAKATILTNSSFTGPQIVATVANLGDAVAHGEPCMKVTPGSGKYSNAGCTEPAGPGPSEAEFEKNPNPPIKIIDKLPNGLEAVGIEGTPQCSLGTNNTPTCTVEGEVPAYKQIEIRIDVKNNGASTGERNVVSVSGGGVSAQSITKAITVAEHGEPTPFGIEQYELTNVLEGGAPDTQAGSHPFETTFTVGLNQLAGEAKIGKSEVLPAALAKDLTFRLPAGLIGNPTPFARCTLAQFFHKPKPTCATQSVLGVAMVTFDEPGRTGIEKVSVPVFNLEPEVGEPARFGFLVTNESPVFVDSAVRAGQDYGIMGITSNITTTAALISAETTFWGVPGKPEHDAYRGEGCLGNNPSEPCQPLGENNPPPFFELPTSCTGEMQSSVAGDSWASPLTSGEYPTLAVAKLPALHGCNRLPFLPSIKVTPDGTAASSSTGLTVDVHNPQEESLNAEGLGEADPRNITVALPAGVGVNPSGSNGLEACSEGLVGFNGFHEFVADDPSTTFTGTLPEGWASGVGFCPAASKIGEATIKTPLLKEPIKGFVYLASQNENPFGSLVAMYIVVEDPESGVLVKLAGEVQLCKNAGETIEEMTCAAPGQLVSTFKNSPQAPFEDAILHFFGGERAPLSTPARCGTYTTTAAFTPWSEESNPAYPGPHTAFSTFEITSGPHGGPCPGASLPFSPTLTSSSMNVNAGAFSPLSTTIGRADGQQALRSVTLHYPPGLLGSLTGVPLCAEPQANEGKCPTGSQIGETIVSAGVGSDPVSVTGGKVFITGPYNGSGECGTPGANGCAPFGLSIVNPVKAGPFDLEHDTSNPNQDPACDCVVVRAKIEVDPHTAALSVTTNPSGPYAIPNMIDGIPVQIQHVNVLINRPNFTFNPTNCAKMEVTGAIGSNEGASSPVSQPFSVTNCANLKFEPKVSISTSGKTSKADGASLTYKVAYPNVPQGIDADIHYVKVELPKQLPSRLTTLQKACTQAQFQANPADCPAPSVIGHAKAIVPNIPVPIEGPVYFVSNGGEAFPNLVMVLQGYGVTINLVGDTYISKSGITSTTFKAIPDNPVSTFEITLPEGHYSALAANGNLCSQKLTMPNEYIAQNGATYIYTAPISVTGCSNTLRIVSKKLKGRTLTLKIAVPAAGRITAGGKGLSRASKTSSDRETVTMVLHLTRRGRFSTKLKLSFAPMTGKRLAKTIRMKT